MGFSIDLSKQVKSAAKAQSGNSKSGGGSEPTSPSKSFDLISKAMGGGSVFHHMGIDQVKGMIDSGKLDINDLTDSERQIINKGMDRGPALAGGIMGQAMSSLKQQGNALAGAQAQLMSAKFFHEAQGYGTAPMREKKRMKASQSLMDDLMGGDDPDDLPVGPGQAYFTHLFQRQAKKFSEKQQKEAEKAIGIFTDAMDGVKTALGMIGLFSDTNTGGLPIDMGDAEKLWFGGKDVDNLMRAQFKQEIQDGVSKIDPKKVRKFVNHDGSLTWEILNDDKTIMNRFTFGDYMGNKIFAQGGYKKFAELLAKAKQKFGPDVKGEFDAIRRNY